MLTQAWHWYGQWGFVTCFLVAEAIVLRALLKEIKLLH